MEKMTLLPKGTIVTLNGFEAELVEDTPVNSPSINEYGLENVKAFVSLSPSSNPANSNDIKTPTIL